MAIVKFNREDEFIEELKSEFPKELKYLNIVRLTNLIKTIPNLAPLRHLIVAATVKVRDDIIRLERYCGDLWGFEKEDKPAWDKAQETHDKIENACRELGLEVRGGIFEE